MKPTSIGAMAFSLLVAALLVGCRGSQPTAVTEVNAPWQEEECDSWDDLLGTWKLRGSFDDIGVFWDGEVTGLSSSPFANLEIDRESLIFSGGANLVWQRYTIESRRPFWLRITDQDGSSAYGAIARGSRRRLQFCFSLVRHGGNLAEYPSRFASLAHETVCLEYVRRDHP